MLLYSELLVIHLNRFYVSPSQRLKIGTLIEFSVNEFDMTEFVDPSHSHTQFYKYELYAVLVCAQNDNQTSGVFCDDGGNAIHVEDGGALVAMMVNRMGSGAELGRGMAMGMGMEMVMMMMMLQNHYGASVEGGHYTAFVRHLHSHRWYSMNDDKVTALSQDDIVSPAAYVLMYRRIH